MNMRGIKKNKIRFTYRNKAKIFSALFFVYTVFSFGVSAQNQLSYNQFSSFGKSSNTVYSLANGGSSLDLVGRYQWVGLDGAPKSYWMNGHFALRKIRAAVGLDVKSHKIGVETNHEVTAYFAKGVRISESEFLGLSMGFGVAQLNGDFSTLDPEDVAFASNVSEFRPTFNIATAIYSPDRYFVGISIPKMVFGQTSPQQAMYRQLSLERVYNVMSVAVFHLGQDFYVKPSTLVTYSPVLPLQIDVSALMFAKQKFGLGIGYRSLNFLAGQAAFHLGNIKVGYAYQFGVGDKPTRRIMNNATHEIGFSYSINNQGLL